jgi:hypothetical protein
VHEISPTRISSDPIPAGVNDKKKLVARFAMNLGDSQEPVEKSTNGISFERKIYVLVEPTEVDAIPTSKLDVEIASAMNCLIRTERHAYDISKGQLYLVRFTGYDRNKVLDKDALKQTISSIFTPMDGEAVRVEVECNGGGLL